MTEVTDATEVVPLATGFDVAWPGYHRNQVRRYVREVEADFRLVSADRDGALRCADLLTARLEAERHENRRLRARLDRVCRTPVDLAGVDERLRHVLELAHAEAAGIRVAAERSAATAHRVDADRRRHYDTLVARLEAELRQAAAEHHELMRRARLEVAALTLDGQRRRRALDEQAARVRARVHEDFELAMSVRRAEAARELAEHVAASREHAERIVSDARAEVAVLTGHRDHLADQLRAVARAVTEAGDALTVDPPPAITPAGWGAQPLARTALALVRPDETPGR
ncbi:MAG: metallopeptidase [Umezawaea sp.]